MKVEVHVALLHIEWIVINASFSWPHVMSATVAFHCPLRLYMPRRRLSRLTTTRDGTADIELYNESEFLPQDRGPPPPRDERGLDAFVMRATGRQHDDNNGG